MAASASTFAAQLVEDLHASSRPCEVWASRYSSETCGRPGGPAKATCQFGHVEAYTTCPECATRQLYCIACTADGDVDVPVTITTEVV